MAANNGSSLPEWDVFIAYPSASWREAGALYDLLNLDFRVFFDRRSLQAGSDFDLAIPRAMRSSRMIAVLVDAGFSTAYYARAEATFALALTREDPIRHRLMPIYLQCRPKITDTPYQLLLKEPLDLATEGSWEAIVAKLRIALNSGEILAESMETPEEASSLDSKVARIRKLPIGPRFQILMVRPSLIQAYADSANADMAPLILADAVFLQVTANPFATYILPSHLPDPRYNSPTVYWRNAFSEACLHGPRMLAALLYALDDSLFPEPVKRERSALLSTLTSWK